MGYISPDVSVSYTAAGFAMALHMLWRQLSYTGRMALIVPVFPSLYSTLLNFCHSEAF